MQASFHFERRNFQEIIFRKFDEFCASEYINYLKSCQVVKPTNSFFRKPFFLLSRHQSLFIIVL